MTTRTAGWALRAVLLAVLAPAAIVASSPPSPATAPPAAPAPGGFTPVTPARILDTRTGLGAPAAKVGPGQAIDVQVAGAAGVPVTGASAVSLNVTVTEPSALGFLTVYPAGEPRPLASNANFVAGQTLANAVVVKLGAGGKVTLFNSSGASHLVADVAGWQAAGRDTGSAFTSVAPVRLFDSRATRALGPGGSVTVRVADGRPASLTAVALNVTATEPSTGGFLTVYPSGTARPLASNLNVSAGQTRANFVAVKVANGAVDIYNSNGTTQVVVDLLGYWSPGSDGRMTAITPTRILDTRSGPFGLPLRSQDNYALHIGDAIVPASRASAVVLNVTATGPTAGGYVTVTPAGVYNPLASNLNFVAGETVPNLVVVPVGYANGVNIYNSNGQTDIVVDIVGWFDIPAQRVDLDGLVAFGSDVKIDPASDHAYVSNPTHNRIEVLRLADGVLEDPILVGSTPMGLDLAPDGSLLYVANRGAAFVSVVDLRTRTEVRRLPIPPGPTGDTPYSIAVLATGKALVATTFWGYGFGSNMLEIDLATGAVRLRDDFFHGGRTTGYTTVRATGDRRSAVAVVGDLSTGPVFRYDATTDAFTAGVNTDTFTSAIATNFNGSVMLVNLNSFVYSREMKLLGTVPGCGTLGVAVNAAGTVGYGLGWDHHVFRGFIAVCDLERFQVTRKVPFGAVDQVGRLELSPDGMTLVGILDTGLVLYKL